MHVGESADAGHFYCYIRDALQKTWSRISDNYVQSGLSEQEVLSSAQGRADIFESAYVLIYVKNEVFSTDNGVYSALREGLNSSMGPSYELQF
jgi:hypothetical protein